MLLVIGLMEAHGGGSDGKMLLVIGLMEVSAVPGKTLDLVILLVT